MKQRAISLARFLLAPAWFLFELSFLALTFMAAVIKRIQPKRQIGRERLVWGSDPIANLSYWSRSMRVAGWDSTTLTTMHYSNTTRAEWDLIINESFVWLPVSLKPYLNFLLALLKYDVFFISFRGFLLNETWLWRTQHFLFRVAGARVVVIPYGADSYVYSQVRNLESAHALMDSYPDASRHQALIAERVSYWVKKADVVVPGFMGPDGIGRWDLLIPSPLSIDLDDWALPTRRTISDGSAESVEIIHTPNHRGFKGTEFIIDAVKTLQLEGLRVNLTLVEGMPNSKVKELLYQTADILIEQLIFTGHGLSAIEGMASGVATVSNLEDDSIMRTFRRWTHFGECPLVSASPESITDVLRILVTSPELRQELGTAGRAYVEKYHGLDSSQFLFERVICFLQKGDRSLLWNLYHPILGAYPNRLPKVTHPLEKSRIPWNTKAPGS